MNAIVVVDRNWAIGCENQLLFSLPSDMKHFRTLTSGGTLIMGRKTLDSFPGGRPLPNRRNIVITRSADFHRDGCEVAASPEQALALAGGSQADHVWLIGGSSVYAQLLPLCRQAYITKVDAAAPRADAFFPDLDRLPGWEVESLQDPMTENGLCYRFITYVNRAI